MENLNLKEVSRLISQKQGKTINIIGFKPIGGGYHSDGFLLFTDNDEKFFIKKIKSNDLGFELPERKINSLLLSNAMSKRTKNHPNGIGIIIKNKNKHLLPDIDDKTEIYHIQEFIPGFEKNLTNYWECIKEKNRKKTLDDADLKEINLIVDAISEIHDQKHPNCNARDLEKIYNDGFRSLLSSPELTLMLIQSYKENDKILPRKLHAKYIGLMLKNIYQWENRHDRLCALHGDFWGSNLYIINNKVQLIDFSRIPWGDAGIDIGWWISQYLWFYYETKNNYYKQSLEKFLEIYSEKNNDKEIYRSIAPVLGLMGVIATNPLFYPNINKDIASEYMENIWRILKKQEFIW